MAGTTGLSHTPVVLRDPRPRSRAELKVSVVRDRTGTVRTDRRIGISRLGTTWSGGAQLFWPFDDDPGAHQRTSRYCGRTRCELELTSTSESKMVVPMHE